MFSNSDGEYLVKLARNTIKTYLEKKQIAFDNSNPKFLERRGIFVTLETNPKKELRGCMGYTLPTKSLNIGTSESALNAAFFDSRFPPLKPNEFDKILIEVSILTPLQPFNAKRIEYLNLVQIGKDGLYIQKDEISAVILPQIAKQEKWTSEEFLCQISYKAGLSPDAWLDKSTHLFKFQSQNFTESAPNGKVVPTS
ncbi:TIGR00296 family protein [Candidatus Micrarchaeota archaeon]|nr:TIGR00296 family protein [Candidatus Micrarchaeota archaeon]